MRRVLICAFAVWAMTGCVEDGGGGGDDPADSDAPDGQLIDGATDLAPDPEPDGTVLPDDGVTPDEGIDPDEGPPIDQGVVEPDAEPPPPPVESCEDACDRIAACERLDQFGDYQGCVDACGRASRRGPPLEWFACLEAEQNCGLIRLCRLPEPPPLTCDEVCGLVDTCEVDGPFPDCLAECNAGAQPDQPSPFALCGESLDPACNAGQFWECLGENVYSACNARCETSIACNLERADTCLFDCIAEGFVDDPLSRRRAQQRTQCISLVDRDGELTDDECRRADACLNPQAGPGIVDRATFCREWDRCAADFGFPCDEAWEIGQQEVPGFAECVVELFRNGCPPDPFIAFEQCFEGGGGPVGPGCAELCEAREVCGDLPEGQDQFACLRECSDALRRSQEESDRQRSLFVCGIVETCDELGECLLENSPLAACEAHCGLLDGCGLGSEGCVADCDAGFFRARQVEARACVAASEGDCEAMAACEPGLPIGCDVRCARLASCGRADGNCEANCDDESFADPARATRQLACVVSAPLCNEGISSVSRCPGNPEVAGADCLGYCRAATGCDQGDVPGLVDCLTACGEGLIGDDGLRLVSADECLGGVDAGGICEPIAACIPDEPAVPCALWCASLAACDLAPADCEEVCPADEAARLRAVTQSACLEAADDCEGVEACIGEQDVIEPPVDVVALCRTYSACGLDDIFPCEILLEEFQADARTLRCVERSLDPCPRDPFLIFELCFDGQPAEPETLEPCAEVCELRGRCGRLDGSIRDCTAACVTGAAREPNGVQAALLVCRDALTCDALDQCVVDNGPAGRCRDVCASAVGCGAFEDDAACLAVCGDQLLDPLTPRRYLDDVAACLDALGPEPGACAETGATCFEIELGDCETACQSVIACNLQVEGDIDECIAGCQADPDQDGILQCILDNLNPPDQCDLEGLQFCVEQGGGFGPEPEPEEPPRPEPR